MIKNSIEEDIKILENMNDGYTFKDCDMCNNYNEKTKCCDKHKCMELQAIEHLLSDYKRVLKEAERYKNMYRAEHEIHLVRNEQLSRKEKAVIKCNELIIENAKLKEENEELKIQRNAEPILLKNRMYFIDSELYRDAIETMRDNYIPKQRIKDKIEELNKLLTDIGYRDIEDKQEREFYKKEYYQVVAQINVLKELLKEEK